MLASNKTGFRELSAITHANIQDFELAHPIIHTIYILWEHVKGLVLQNHSHRIYMTLCSNSRITKRNFSEGPISVVYQKSEALNQANNSLKRLFARKAV